MNVVVVCVLSLLIGFWMVSVVVVKLLFCGLVMCVVWDRLLVVYWLLWVLMCWIMLLSVVC